MRRGETGRARSGSKKVQAVAVDRGNSGQLKVRASVSCRTGGTVAAGGALLTDRQEQDRATVEVLRGAAGLLQKHGWLGRFVSESDRFAAIRAGKKNARGWSLVDAVQHAGNASISSHHARQVMGRLVGPVAIWEDHPLRTSEEVFTLINRAIELCGGGAPVKRGGWRIGGAE